MIHRNLLLIYPKDTFELLNRKSALGSYLLVLADLLEKKGYTIQVNDISLADLKKNNRPSSTVTPGRSGILRHLPSLIKNFLRDVLLIRKYRSLLSNILNSGFKPDLILDIYSYGSDIGYQVQRALKVPRVMVFDAPVIEEHAFFHGKSLTTSYMYKLQNKNILEASSLVVYSNAVKAYIKKVTGRSEGINIHQNVDYSRFEFLPVKEQADEINICFIGSFLKWHRIDLLVNVFLKISSEFKNTKLFLIGDGMERESIEDFARSKNEEKIIFTGFKDSGELASLKADMHIGVMPGSNWYGAPNKIFEYGAAGMAVIAPDTPTIKDLFSDKEHLLLFIQDNEDDMHEKLRKLCIDKTERVRLSRSLQNLIRQRYSEEQTVSFYNNLFEEALR